jgi:hypothetical protein
MMDAVLSLPGGILLGALAGIIGFFFIEILREAKTNSRSMAIPGLILAAYFGFALWGAANFASSNGWLLLWFILAALWVMRKIYERDP